MSTTRRIDVVNDEIDSIVASYYVGTPARGSSVIPPVIPSVIGESLLAPRIATHVIAAQLPESASSRGVNCRPFTHLADFQK